MAAIRIERAKVYVAPSRGRRFLTARAAARAEAAAVMVGRYPTERGDERDGYSSWHWSSDERLVRVHARLTRMLLKKLRQDKRITR